MKQRTLSTLFGTVIFLLFSTAVAASDSVYKGVTFTKLTPKQQLNFNAGFAALEQNKYLSANRLFLQITKEQPDSAAGWIGLSFAANSVSQFNHAVKQAQQLSKKGTIAEKVIADIQGTYITGDTEQRIHLVESLVVKFPESSFAWWIKADGLASADKTILARKSYEKAIQLADNHLLPYFGYGNNLMFSEPKDFAKAETIFQQALDIQPGNSFAHIKLGDSHRAQQKLQLALEDYTRATLISPNDSSALTKKGHVNTFLGKYKSAYKDFDAAISVGEPGNTMFLANYKAFTHLYQNKPMQAIKELNQWLAHINTMPLDDKEKAEGTLFTLTNLAKIELHHSMFTKAKQTLEQREMLIEDQIKTVDDKLFNRIKRANIHFYRGYLEARQGDLKTANATAEKMFQLLQPVKDPGKLENYHELKGFISMKGEQWDNAIAHYNKANQKKVYVKYHKALALENKGDRKAAHDLFVEVKNYNFNSVDYALVRDDAIEKSQFLVSMVSLVN